MLHFRVIRAASERLLGSPSADILTMKEPRKDRRVSSRINQSQNIRIRPAEPNYTEEIRSTLNASWDGLYFATSIEHYSPGMIVYVTRDFYWNDPKNREEQGTIVRVDKLKEGRWGVAVKLARGGRTDQTT